MYLSVRSLDLPVHFLLKYAGCKLLLHLLPYNHESAVLLEQFLSSYRSFRQAYVSCSVKQGPSRVLCRGSVECWTWTHLGVVQGRSRVLSRDSAECCAGAQLSVEHGLTLVLCRGVAEC